jgi:hypothetical protein
MLPNDKHGHYVSLSLVKEQPATFGSDECYNGPHFPLEVGLANYDFANRCIEKHNPRSWS